MIEKFRNLNNNDKQVVFVLSVLIGGLEVVLLGTWIAGNREVGVAFGIVNATWLAALGTIWLATKLFPTDD